MYLGVYQLLWKIAPPLIRRYLRKRARLAPAYLQHWDCIIYTSEAAEDMQYVDLGGRRVIQKKTNWEKMDCSHVN